MMQPEHAAFCGFAVVHTRPFPALQSNLGFDIFAAAVLDVAVLDVAVCFPELHEAHLPLAPGTAR